MTEFDPRTLSHLNDGQLSELVSKIAATAGTDAGKTAALLANLDSLRATLSGMTAEQAKQLLDRAGEEKSRTIRDLLQKNGSGDETWKTR